MAIEFYLTNLHDQLFQEIVSLEAELGRLMLMPGGEANIRPDLRDRHAELVALAKTMPPDISDPTVRALYKAKELIDAKIAEDVVNDVVAGSETAEEQKAAIEAEIERREKAAAESPAEPTPGAAEAAADAAAVAEADAEPTK